MDDTTGIHPAPEEFTPAEIQTDPILQFFHYRHLPPQLQRASRPFCDVAGFLVRALPRNAERTVALRKLLEAKDAAVRANLPTPGAKPAPSGDAELQEGELIHKGSADGESDPPFFQS